MILAPAIMTSEKDQKKAAFKCFESVGLDPDSYRIGHTKARHLFLFQIILDSIYSFLCFCRCIWVLLTQNIFPFIIIEFVRFNVISNMKSHSALSVYSSVFCEKVFFYFNDHHDENEADHHSVYVPCFWTQSFKFYPLLWPPSFFFCFLFTFSFFFFCTLVLKIHHLS